MNPVYLYWPNLVGYGRIISTIIAFVLVFTSPVPAAICYALGQAFDAVDGIVARAMNQTSRFGALLDMLTDRMSTAVLLIVLAQLYPHQWGTFAGLIVLDIVSHWCQMFSKLAANKATHKGSRNPILNFYYTFPYALLVFCVGNEAFFISLYLRAFASSFSSHPLFVHIIEWVLFVSFPISALKQFMNVVQLYDACNEICEMDRPAVKPVGRTAQPSH